MNLKTMNQKKKWNRVTKITYLDYSILQKIYISNEIYKMSLLSNLFHIWFGSGKETWGNQGWGFGFVENIAL